MTFETMIEVSKMLTSSEVEAPKLGKRAPQRDDAPPPVVVWIYRELSCALLLSPNTSPSRSAITTTIISDRTSRLESIRIAPIAMNQGTVSALCSPT
jgi:hypothetical protein